MSAILGCFGAWTVLTPHQVSQMLAPMHGRGTERRQVWRDGDVVLAVSRYEWELGHDFSDVVLISEDEDLVVAADASLYYRAELMKALKSRGVTPRSAAPAHLIAAAYTAWHERCVDRIEGDFAFIIWDRKRRRVLVARDAGGKRPLHYAEIGRELVVASSIAAVVAHPRCSDDLNLPVLAGTAAGLILSAGPETCYSAVRVMPNAHWLAWDAGRTHGPHRYWEPQFDKESDLPHEQAAEQLRDLLGTATRERLAHGQVNTVWMSGGWDSTSVFAAAQDVARDTNGATRVLPVSISYPKGDPGREDEWINAVAKHWSVPVHWLDIADIPLFDREPERALDRDQPFVHLYEHWNRALATGSRACGSRVAFDGNGGDQLFQNSDVFLADLLRKGKLLRLAHEWRARSRGGFRNFFAWAIQPNLGKPLLDLAALMRGGRRLRHYLERPVPNWLDPKFVARHCLVERDLEFVGRPIRASHGQRELDWYLTCLFVARAYAYIGEFALAAGVELRSPLSDRRIIDFALARPWWERSSGRETKLLLRRAMHGLLPDEVLAPRAQRTGVTSGYSYRWMRDAFPQLLEETLRSPLLLEELGVLRADLLTAASVSYAKNADLGTGVKLFFTLQTELWLRTHQPSARNASTPVDLNESRVA
jgi:asparagine synthase (glutamine-hydrolysing)